MDKKEIIALLKKDMQGEHQAIIQYLAHAYSMDEGGAAGALEAVAREEMRHFDWLADAISELGGDPSTERDPVDFSPGPVSEQLGKDVGLEDTAIAQYQAHIDAIDDEGVRLILSRILHDEKVHRTAFAEMAKAAEIASAESPQEGDKAPEAGVPKRLGEILNQGIRHEYTVVLQYLYHSFVTGDKEFSESLMMRAINEMQHMGWLSEEMAERGGEPDMSHTELFLSQDDEKNLEADIAVERAVSEDYTRHLPELNDEELEKLVTRIRDHEIFHIALFEDLLKEIRAEEGSAEVPEEESQPEEPATPSEPPEPTIPSVGSLIDEN